MKELEFLTNFHFVNEFWTFLLPLILMGTDFLTGTINAWIKGEIQSSKMRQGLGKKVGEIVVLILGSLTSYALGLPHYIMTAVSLYIVIMEVISIFENLKKLGVPIPKVIDSALVSFEKSMENGELSDQQKKEIIDAIEVIKKEA